MRHRTVRRFRAATASAVAAGLLAGCAGAGGAASSPRGGAVSVLMVNNPQMAELRKLTAAHFTKETGIEVNFTTLPENDIRDKAGQDFANQTGQYDVATISNFEVPFYARNGWLRPLDAYAAADSAFDRADLFEPVRRSLTAADGRLYAVPFYGESSFLMYRKDVFAEQGLAMPAHPTWQQVADLAAAVDGARKGMRGICLRGQPGWGEVIAPLTTLVNTFGGTWFTKDWQARLTSPEFVRATEFYVRLVREHGEKGAAQSGYAECLNAVIQGRTAMWYDATAAAGPLEASGSPVKGRIGYVPAPVERTAVSGWLYTWAWGLQKASENPDRAWRFIAWASGKEYEALVGRKAGWADVPAGKRASTYESAPYRRAAAAFWDVTRASIASTDPWRPGTQPRPAPGIQFVGIPEFSGLGTKVSREISAAISGRQSVATALRKSQAMAERVGERYRSR
ncbi:ABC transporter substrate-binding protein [Streptomyces roseoverticillatus]|uniref:ABC transporter substrate-binding protein n=1 Tax=Streptomyces roseoverticillatus TaxID=66429 RepID=UPI003F5403CD